jgi:toxin ParE1/3/4
MNPQFRLTEPAVKDIEQIVNYIAKKAGLLQSEGFLTKLDDKFAKIVQFPNLGRRRDEILVGLRSLPIDNYLILYMPIDEDVEILRVISGYRDISALFAEESE